MNHDMRRLKQSITAGALLGVVLWSLFFASDLGTDHLPKNIYLFGLVSFLLFVATTAAISLILFYAVPTCLVYFMVKYTASSKPKSMHDNFGKHHTVLKLRYRLFTGLIFAVAATIALPIFHAIIGIFTEGSIPTARRMIGAFTFGAIFSIAAFICGTFLTSRFLVSATKNRFSSIIISFLWGCAITALTIFSTGFFIGLFESIRHMEVSIEAFEYGLLMWGFGSVFTFGIVYVVGGIAGVITSICYRRIPNSNETRI